MHGFQEELALEGIQDPPGSRSQPLLGSTHTPEAKLTPTELARKYTLPLVCSPGKIKNDLTFHHLI